MLDLVLLVALSAQDDLDAKRTAALKTSKDKVASFVEKHCVRCHGIKGRPKGGVIFTYALKSPATPSFRPLWKNAAAQIKAGSMPPEEEKQPTAEERRVVLEWIAGMKYLSPKDPGEFVIRRLNRVEYANTLRDLLGVDPKLADELPQEVFGAGYTNSVSPLLMEKYLAIANEAIGQMTDTPLLEGEPRAVARSLARKAYRRPATEAEVDLLMRVRALAKEKGRSEEEARRLMLKAVLVSPQFLFITPGGDAPEQAIVPLDDHQLAARLSYFLWSAPPDAELSALADAGTLREALAGQTRRMLADPRSRALFDGFGMQWLGLDKLAGKTFDPRKFPQMNAALREAMVEEARLLFESILRENASLASLIEADYTFVNETLAPIYGLEASGPEMRRVALKDRGGILTMPGVLAQTSFPDRTSPVNRGAWVLEQVLGEHVPPPPADVPALEDQKKEDVAALTLRQRTELHRTNPTCASCHRVLDPIGFGLENFDAIGRWRDRDDTGGPIDASGELPGDLRFTSPQELKAIVASRVEDVARNLAGRLLAYALCRQLEGHDEVVVDQLAADVAKDGYRLPSLVVAVVTSYPFTHRRVHDLKGASNAK